MAVSIFAVRVDSASPTCVFLPILITTFIVFLVRFDSGSNYTEDQSVQ